ncbi:MAG TPA: aminotransferase class I/II-fold pyridoxal phosphate-dependent enzyme [Candidatus Saccharimonadales bacterium]|nr:aminotransferase class I/II-fold pyridoxal phosphate-dependent enzyme [Candidatus Saccharimonadales bacterium]
MKTKIRLGLNELPFPPEAAVVKAARRACAGANRYPEWDGASLRTALAKRFRVTMDWVVVAGGSAAVIQQIMIASGQGEVAFGWPSFDAFPAIAEGLRMPVRRVELLDHACDLDKLAKALTPQTSVVILCTPNTPTGGVIAHEVMASFLQRLPSHIIAIIDEAYGEFVRDKTAVRALEFVQRYPNVVMTRSFSKAFGMAGFRVGYAIAQPELAARIISAGVPFSVPLPAQEAALAALQNEEEAVARIEEIIQERHRLTTALRAFNTEVVEGNGNFIWLPLGELAAKVATLLADHGIMVKALMPHGVRITVGTPKETDYLLKAWSKVVSLIKEERQVA